MKTHNTVLVGLVILSAFWLTSAAYGLTADEVLSEHIQEADGTSGQKTNTGSGIKTKHIQNRAITSKKIKNKAVTTAKIRDGAVTTPKLQDNAVTGAKIADGTISAADTDATLMAGSPYTLVVATAGGDYNSIQGALDAIGSSLPGATADQPYLVKVMPGTYTEQVTMKPYVHIQGSGIDVSIITYSATNDTILIPNDAARLSHLTVKNITTSGQACAISTEGASAIMVIDHVKAEATGVTRVYGIFNENSSPTITNCTSSGLATGTGSVGYGIFNDNSSPTIINCSASGSGGTNGGSSGITSNNNSFPTITNCILSGHTPGPNGTAYGITCNTGSSPSITNTQAKGTAEEGGGFGLRVYDSSSHPKVKNSTLEGSGTSSYSIYITSGSSASFGNCQLIGAINQPTGKRVNCYDGDFNPVPNL